MTMAARSSNCTEASVCWSCKGRLAIYHAHPQAWNSSELKEFFLALTNVAAIPSVCICRACDSDIKKGFRLERLGKSYTPRWQKKIVKWSIPTCTEKSCPIIRNHSFSVDTICSCLGVSMLHHDGSSSVLPLCNYYLAVYRFYNPERVCSVCGCGRKHYSVSAPKRFFACPDPTRVEAFLHETVDFDSFW